jgi:MATE family multidrug resistance protein
MLRYITPHNVTPPPSAGWLPDADVALGCLGVCLTVRCDRPPPRECNPGVTHVVARSKMCLWLAHVCHVLCSGWIYMLPQAIGTATCARVATALGGGDAVAARVGGH